MILITRFRQVLGFSLLSLLAEVLAALFSIEDVSWQAIRFRIAAISLRDPSGKGLLLARAGAGKVTVDLRSLLLGRPRFHIECSRIEARLGGDRSIPVSIDGLEADVALSGSTIVFETVRAQVGRGAVTIEGRIERAASEPRFDLRIRAQQALVIATTGLRGRCDADLRLEGALSRCLLTGSVTLRRTRITSRISTSKTPAGPEPLLRLPLDVPEGLRSIGLDVRITGGKDILIENNVIDCRLEIDGKLTGTLASPVPDATIRLVDGKIHGPTSDFTIGSGAVTFRSWDPWRPYLDIASRTRIRSFEVSLRIVGPADAPALDLSSQPPLSREDVAALVSTGHVATRSRENGGSAAEDAFGGLAERFNFRPEPSRSGPRSPVQGTAELKLNEAFFLQAQRDEFGYYNLDLVFRLRFR